MWSTPTFDEKRQAIYIATGDNYSDPPTQTSDAVLTLDAQSGKLLWSQQATAGDAYNVACNTATPGNCPPKHGGDFDFGQSPVLVTLASGRRLLVIAQKSGLVHAFDPDDGGKAHGGSLDVTGPVIACGMLYVTPGYGQWGGIPRNVLLAYSIEAQ